MADIFRVGVRVDLRDGISSGLRGIANLFGRAETAATRFQTRLDEMNRAQGVRSQLFGLQDLERRGRLESRLASERGRSAALETRHLERQAAIQAQLAQATTQSYRGDLSSTEYLEAQEKATTLQRAMAAEQSTFDEQRITAANRLSEIQSQGARQAEMAQLRRNDQVAREVAQREEIVRLQRSDQMRGTAIRSLAAGAAAFAGADILYHLARAGGNLQQAQTLFQMQTGMTGREGETFGRTAREVSGVTMFSVPQIYEQAAQMFREGIGVTPTGAGRVSPIQALLPIFSRAAEDIYQSSRGEIQANETVQALSNLAHQFGKYTPAEMGPIVDLLARVSLMAPQGLQPFVAAGGYVIPQAVRQLGIPPEQLLTMMLAGQMTFGAGGGTGMRGAFSGAALNRMFTNLMHPSKKGEISLAAMGMLGPGGAHLYEPGGRFDLTRLVHLLGQFEQRVKSDPAYRASRAAVLGLGPKASAQDVVVAALQAVGGAAGARPMGALADPQFVALIDRLAKTLPELPGAIEQQTIWLNTLNDQTKRTITNFSTLASDIGTSTLGFQSLISKVGDFAMVLDRTVLAHRTATGVGVEGLEAATGLAAIASATGLARVGAFALGMGEATSALITFGGQLGVISLAIYELARIADWGISKFGSTGNVFPPGTPLPALDSSPRAALSHLSPAARASFYTHPVPVAAPGEPVSAHGEAPIHIGVINVHYEKSTPGDAEKLIADIRRGVRSTGSSTGAAGPESVGVHGFPIR